MADRDPYLVLARKYRPGKFSEIIGQTHVVQTLQNALDKGRLAHAFLFSGPRGVGKTTMARLLAKAVNCVHGPTTTPCNECEFCLEIAGGNALDVYEIDGASNNSVDDVRSIRENVHYAASKARHKIYIIDEVHMLSTSAFNALLKTLEEPPPHVLFMFATTEVHKIPITIISRCQHFEFKLLTVSEIMNSCSIILESENINCSKKALRMIARAAEGSLRDAQSILDQVINVSSDKIDIQEVKFVLGSGDPALMNDLFEGMCSNDLARALLAVNAISETGYDLYQLARDMIYSFRNLLVIKSLPKPLEIIDLSEEEYKNLADLARRIQLDQIENALLILTEMENAIKKSSNPRFVLETVIAKITRYSQLVPLESVLQKLDALKDNVPIGSDEPVLPPPAKVERETQPNTGQQKIETSDVVEKQQEEPAKHEKWTPPKPSHTPQKTSQTDSGTTDDTPVDDAPVDKPYSGEKDEEAKPNDNHGPAKTFSNEGKGATPLLTFAGEETSSDSKIVSSTAGTTETEPTPVETPGPTEDDGEPETGESTSPPGLSEPVEKEAQTPSKSDVVSIKEGSERSIWERAIRLLEQKKRSLSAILENVYLITLTEKELVISMQAHDNFSIRILEDVNNQKLLISQISEITGTKPHFRLEKHEQDVAGYSVAADRREREREQFEKLKETALKNTMVQTSLDLFQGVIVDIQEKTPDQEGDLS